MSEKKLKIIGPYTPEHPGPFCTRGGRAARVICTDRAGDWPLVALLDDGEREDIVLYTSRGCVTSTGDRINDLMNAEEVPVAREFWVNEYTYGLSERLHLTEASAKYWSDDSNFLRTIHVREVLPGDGE